MNTYSPDNIFCKAKTRQRCFVLLLCFHLALGDVPSPCRHSVTKDHLQKLKRLIENQLQNGCVINYTFTEHLNLGKICYVKAAFHQIQDLLHSHFKFPQSSDNYRYVNELKDVINNIFSQKCIPDIDQAHEDDPIKFQKVYSSSPKEALQKVENVIEMYMQLMTESNSLVNWDCEEEYARDYPQSTTETIQTTGPTTQCHCSCPTFFHGSSDQVSFTVRNPWNEVPNPNSLQPQFPEHTPGITQTPRVTQSPVGCQPADLGFDSSSKMETADTSMPSGGNKVYEDASSTDGLAIFGGTDTNTKHRLNFETSTKENDVLAFTTPYRSFQPVSASFDPFTSEALDDNAAWNMPAASAQVAEDYTDETELGSDAPSMARLDSTESATQNGIYTFTTSGTGRESMLKTSHRVNSKKSLDESPTAISLEDAPFGVTPKRLDENTAVILVKRSVDPRLNQLHSVLESDSKSWIAPLVPNLSGAPDKERGGLEDLPGDSKNLEPTPQVAEEFVRTTPAVIPILRGNEDTMSKLPGLLIRQSSDSHPPTDLRSSVPNRETIISVALKGGEVASSGNASHSLPHLTAKGSSPDKSVDAHGSDTQMNTSEPPDISYKIAFIMASVCGGLLLVTTIYCYNQKQKFKAVLHRNNMTENQRLNTCSSDLEMQKTIVVWQRCAAEEEEMVSNGDSL
ncbi:macrophage colony-stimulating factor 1 isoform X1 [Arapaima gigas]